MTLESGTASEGLSYEKKTNQVIFQISLLSLHPEVRLWDNGVFFGGGDGEAYQPLEANKMQEQSN